MRFVRAIVVGLLCLPGFPNASAQVTVTGKDALAAFDRGTAAIEREDYPVARSELDLACQYGVGTACYNLGILTATGRGGSADKAKAADHFKIGCDGRYTTDADEKSCFNYGLALEQGWKTGTPNFVDARRYYLKACDLGEAAGCLNAANMLLLGKGGDADGQKAIITYKRGCDLRDAGSCFNVGYSLVHKKGTDPDGQAPGFYRSLACSYGKEDAC